MFPDTINLEVCFNKVPGLSLLLLVEHHRDEVGHIFAIGALGLLGKHVFLAELQARKASGFLQMSSL